MAAMAAVTPQTTRRSQAERSQATRAALLDATVACLVEEGYANTTTTRVAERAGVSRGAHLHHFQTRGALVAAALDHLSRRRTEEMIEAARDLPEGGRERIAAGLDLLWATYANPLFQAAMALWTNARTDPDLRPHLLEVERELDRQTVKVAATIFPELADDARLEPLLEMAVATARGLSLLDTLDPEEGRNAAQWPFCRERLVEMFEELTGA